LEREFDMKRIAMSVAAIGMLVMPLAGVGTASAAPAKDPAAARGGDSVNDYLCTTAGLGGEAAAATCTNNTDQARYAHFHVDCWALGDSDTDQTKWVGAWGEVSFFHTCWSHVQGVEAYFN
jgi:hypothetical protein